MSPGSSVDYSWNLVNNSSVEQMLMVQARQVINVPGWTVNAERAFVILPAGGSYIYKAKITRAITGTRGTVVILQVFGGGIRDVHAGIASVAAFDTRPIWALNNNYQVEYSNGVEFQDKMLLQSIGNINEFSFTERILRQSQGVLPDTVSLAYYGLSGDFATSIPVQIENIPISSSVVTRTITLRRDNRTEESSLIVGVLYHRPEPNRIVVYDIKAIGLERRFVVLLPIVKTR